MFKKIKVLYLLLALSLIVGCAYKSKSMRRIDNIIDKPVSDTPLFASGKVTFVGKGRVKGWFFDPKQPMGGAPVRIYADRPAKQGGVYIGATVANLYDADVAADLHLYRGQFGFDAQLHFDHMVGFRKIYVYGVRADLEAKLTLLDGSGQTTQGTVKSHVNSPMAFNSKKWKDTHLDFSDIAYEGRAEIAFFGDSVVSRMRVTGAKSWKMYFSDVPTANFGYSNQRIQHQMYHFIHDGFPDVFRPKLVVLYIGTKNIAAKNDKVTHVYNGIKTLINMVLARSTKAKVLYVNILPRGLDERATDLALRKKITEVNMKVNKFAESEERVSSLDLTSLFIDADNNEINTMLYSKGKRKNLYPNSSGYSVMLSKIREKLESMDATIPKMFTEE